PYTPLFRSVPFGLPREIAYQKELELTIARSYGPGRYDPAFEEKGLDYPIGYVHWTETRNLEAFLQLVKEGRVDPLSLVSHRFGIEEAPRAYAMLSDDPGAHPLGIVLSYPSAATPSAVEPASTPSPSARTPPRSTVPLAKGQAIVIGFVGAGTFARSTLLPILKKCKDVRLRTVVTTQGVTALQAQR